MKNIYLDLSINKHFRFKFRKNCCNCYMYLFFFLISKFLKLQLFFHFQNKLGKQYYGISETPP